MTEAYDLLKGGECGPLLSKIAASWIPPSVPATLTDLYTAGGNACLARWAPAQAAFQRIDTTKLCDASTLFMTKLESLAACQETRLRVYQWTENLIKAHNANPAFVPNFPTPAKG